MKKNIISVLIVLFCGTTSWWDVKADAYEMLGHMLPNRGVPCAMRDEQVIISPTTLAKTDEFFGMNLGQQSGRCHW